MKHHLHHSSAARAKNSGRNHRRMVAPKKGFTLLEVILSIGIMALLIGSVFTITNASAMLSQSVVINQTQHRHKVALESYLERIFINLPYDAQITLTEEDSAPQTLTIQNPGTFFPSLQNDYFATLFAVTTTKNDQDLIDVTASWQSLTTEDTEETTTEIATEYQQSITLISNLTSLQWEIYSTTDDTWYTTWSVDQGQPTHVRLTYSHLSNEVIETITFWIPPRVESQ